jgi:hypothetical protein
LGLPRCGGVPTLSFCFWEGFAQIGERSILTTSYPSGAQKNRHFFQLERKDYRDKGCKSWDVEFADMPPQSLIVPFVRQHPDAVEERFQRREVVKFVIRCNKNASRREKTRKRVRKSARHPQRRYACRHMANNRQEDIGG